MDVTPKLSMPARIRGRLRTRLDAPAGRAAARWRRAVRVGVAAGAVGAAGLAGCASVGDRLARLGEGVGYYWHSVVGHVDLIRRATDVDTLLGRDDLDPVLRGRLERARAIRRFAVTELHLPDNGSYTRYTALARPFVTWGVVASPPLSLTLSQWCFPIAGCVTYRGYYDLAKAEAYAARLAASGLDVAVNGVPAYSTLGWFDDPLLSTFVNYPDAELARLIFHELSHQVVYVKGDSMFNESFATAVESLGVERWLARHGTAVQRTAWLQQRARREQFLALLGRHRDRLASLYASDLPDEDKRAGKVEIFADLQAEYRALRAGPWAGFAGYDRWFNRPLGNAHLGAIATYTTWVPAFQRLFAEAGQDFARFYLRVAELAARPPSERAAALQQLGTPPDAVPLPPAAPVPLSSPLPAPALPLTVAPATADEQGLALPSGANGSAARR